jgi:hypothetical protein
VPSLERLVSNLCTIVAAFGFLHLALYVVYPAERVRARLPLRLVTLLVAAVLMVAMLVLSTPPQGLGIFAGLYRAQPTLAVYALTYSLYLGIAVVDLGLLALRSIRYSRRWLRAGMLVIGLGCVLAVGYLAAKVIGVITELVTGQAAERYCAAAFDVLEIGVDLLGHPCPRWVLSAATVPRVVAGTVVRRPPSSETDT